MPVARTSSCSLGFAPKKLKHWVAFTIGDLVCLLSFERQLSLQENQGDIQKEELERLVEFVMESIHREDDDSCLSI